MIEREWLPPLIRRLKAGKLVPEGEGTPVRLGGADLERLLPHRGPMLLVDAIEVVDLPRQAVRGRRRLKESDPGFAGHFPGEPVYPGVLLVEAIGQLGLTLLHFTSAQTIEVPPATVPSRARLTHVHYAAFLAPVAPGDELTLFAQVVDSGLTAIAAGQAYKGDALTAYAVSEVYLDD